MFSSTAWPAACGSSSQVRRRPHDLLKCCRRHICIIAAAAAARRRRSMSSKWALAERDNLRSGHVPQPWRAGRGRQQQDVGPGAARAELPCAAQQRGPQPSFLGSCTLAAGRLRAPIAAERGRQPRSQHAQRAGRLQASRGGRRVRARRCFGARAWGRCCAVTLRVGCPRRAAGPGRAAAAVRMRLSRAPLIAAAACALRCSAQCGSHVWRSIAGCCRAATSVCACL